jgi:predicted ATPase/GAF domain-containing protein/tRNA A-37 threonylcarbamoyl transferase component Bud32
MIKLEGYTITNEIYSSAKTVVYQGIKKDIPVIIKYLNQEYPEILQISSFKKEFSLLEKIKSKSIINVLAFEKYKNSYAIIFEDIGGDSLIHQLKNIKKYSLQEIVSLFIKITEALGMIHKFKLIHKDIKPHNIILNPNTGELQIIDFGSATYLTKENSKVELNSSIEGTLSYISPEQTGRMNRAVDYRTDYYSLGVTFYQLLTGELPFIYQDPLELIHAHIAKNPTPVHEKIKCPKAISLLISKLLNKNPEDRYQSIQGILYDLEKCKKYLEEENLNILDSDTFVIAEKDYLGKFLIPEKLYGREKEISLLTNTFQKAVEGTIQLALISGRSGIGKSVLINEIHKPITKYKGYFISGKYDLFKRTIPYRAITQSFQSLIQQILSEPLESIEKWKEKILLAVGSNGKLIIDFIPELESLIGEQPPVPELDPNEAQNRFNLVFLNFMKAFCREENPITLFLDDLQWADSASIQLLDTIFSDSDVKYLFMILSYRDNEVYPTDAFSLLIEKLKKDNFSISEIILNPISLDTVNELIADTLNSTKERTLELAQIIQDKTKGNPFFVNEVFKDLYDKELIYFSNDSWEWDTQRIQQINISDNVIDLMIQKVKELPEKSLNLLKLAACVGDWFRNDVFQMITNLAKEELDEELVRISNEGFFIISDNITRFVHDKIKEATYSLVEEKERAKNHYTIGKTYLKVAKENEIEELIFTIVNQLNQGISFISDENEKTKLLDLNILAGKKSNASAAYEASRNFFTKASELLPNDHWKIDYSKSIEVFSGKGKSEFLSKDFEQAEKTFEHVLANSRDLLDKISIYELRFAMYSSQNRFIEVLNLGKSILKMLKINLPKNPNELSPLPEIIKAKIKIGKKEILELYDLPTLKDEKLLAAMRILNLLIAPSFIAQPALFPVIVLKMVNISLRSGNSSLSAMAFSAFGVIQGSGLGDYKTGLELCKLGIKLLDKFDAKSLISRTNFFSGVLVNHWIHHAKESRNFLLISIEKGLETGDLQYSSYSINHLNIQRLLMRTNLSSNLEYFEKYIILMQNIKQKDSLGFYRLFEQFTLNLTGKSSELLYINGEKFNNQVILKEWIESKNSTTLFGYYVANSMLQYLLGDKETALDFSNLAIPHEGGVFGMMFIPEHVFFDTLILAKLFPISDKKRQKEFLNRIQKNLKRMKKWGENCEANYGHKFYIMEGVHFFILGKSHLGMESLKKAILLAKKHEYILEEALANELLAEIWEKQGDEDYANLHIKEAHYAYQKWGCEPKVKQLEEKYSSLFRKISHTTDVTSISNTETTRISGSGSTSLLDLNTVLKASQTISGEIHLGKLLERMLKILFENAGAERGIFVLNTDDKWLVQAVGNSNKDETEVLKSKPLEEANDTLCIAIANYVIRTKSLVLLDDAQKNGMYTNDIYIKSNKIRSVICYPIINKRNLVGVVYLENNLTSNAFTPDRIEILKVLSSQIAVSIENSLLYSNLEEKVAIRTKDLNQALVEVRALKEQQDGDYFLTTLLIEPLAQNNAKSENVSIDFFIKQKKNFVFRKREYELGGDINITENIELMNQPYIAFLNADAMGKSIQGAGGVLVLGTVFKSIIQRTILTSYGKNTYPERWVKNAFIEMHKVFESFDGSMLMSLTFGLIDVNSGIMYFIVAEHPETILYRDGKAEFLHNKNEFKKLGTQGQKGKISIEVFQLQKDDMIFIGSDGKDDLILGKEANSSFDLINQDEKLILTNIEKGKGELNLIYESILSSGKLMDDLSLLKIHWKKEIIVQNIEENKKFLLELEAKEKYKELSELGLKLIQEYPAVSEFLYLTSFSLMKLREFEKAIDLGERLYIREPENEKNLALLIESYKEVGNIEKSISLEKSV